MRYRTYWDETANMDKKFEWKLVYRQFKWDRL